MVGGLTVLGAKTLGEVVAHLTGRTRMNHVVTFQGEAELLGKLVHVEITEGHPFRLSGTLKA